MRIDERVVHATALTHALPGSALVVADENHRELTIARHPSAQIDPCRWRRAIVRAIHRPEPGLGSVSLVTVAGDTSRCEGGTFVDHRDPLRRWTTTTLSACELTHVLRSAELDGIDDDGVTATLRPDGDLGIVVVGIGVDDEGLQARLNDLASSVAAALLVGELERGLPVA